MTAAIVNPNTEKTERELEQHRRRLQRGLRREVRFTQAYRENLHKPPYELEALCLRAQYPDLLEPIQEGDWFAGRCDRPLVGVDPERGGLTEAGYFCVFDALERMRQDASLDPATRKDAEDLITFWRDHHLYPRCRKRLTEAVRQALPNDDFYSAREIAYPFYGFGGPVLDYAKLVRIGIVGLRQQVRDREAKARRQGQQNLSFYLGLHTALDIFSDCARWYAQQARTQAGAASTADLRDRFRFIAQNLEHIAEQPARSYAEAIQLFWLYSIIALPRNYGRLDVTLGDFLARDLASGVLTYEQASELTIGLWNLILARGDNFNNRLVIGGRGRPIPENADRFAMLALEVQASVHGPIPQISLRWHEGMNRALWDKALEVLAGGSTHPMLYNDDVNVPAVAKAFGVSGEEAEQYVMYGCGEYVLEHRSVGSPDAAINVAKALDVTIHNGIDAFSGERRGLALGHLRDFATFEQFRDAYVRQVEHQVSMLADAQATIYRVTGEHLAFPFLSLLYDDCIARGKPLLAGGARYLGGTLESFGNTTAADSLLAIKKTVFDEKLLVADELATALRDNLDDARVRRILRQLPKYGNDHPEADAVATWLNVTICQQAMREGKRVGLDSFHVVLVNNGDHATLGRGTAATADGRQAGLPLSNGNQPTAGNDVSGLTALLNSMAKLDPTVHAGATHNLKLSRRALSTNRAQIAALLKGYFARGGIQLMVTTTDPGELEDAMNHPENYANLFVRVGGYSARFIDLPRDLQQDILRRTLY